MKSLKSLYSLFRAMSACVFLAGCASPIKTPIASPTLSLPSQTTTQPIGKPIEKQGIFKLFKTVAVTPAGNFKKASFTRVGYVPERDAMVVTFDTMLEKAEGACTDGGYAYREFNLDMVETGQQGLINCYGGIMDTAGFFVGNDFYFAFQSGGPGGKEGWMLAKYDAVTWKPSVPATFFGLPERYDPGDPMIAVVNGQIDISSKIMTDPKAPGNCPYVHCWTHHEFFTQDLKPVGKRVLSDTYNVNISSLIQTEDGVIHFITASSYGGDMIVLQYDKNWNYLGTKTLKQKSGAPEGVAFDGSRFYVSFIDVAATPNNVHLAAFDKNWNLLEDVLVTSYTSQDLKALARPSLALHNNRIYVSYDQDEHVTDPPVGPEKADMQAYVKVYEINPEAAISTPAAELSAVPSSQAAETAEPTLVSDFTPCEGAPSGKVATPQAGRALIAHSTDGIHFERPKNAQDGFLMDRIGVPDGVVLPNGRILVYLVDGCRPQEDPNNTGIAVAISDQHGAPGSWFFKHVKYSTVPDEYSGPFDPNVVVLPDGSIRMFATMARLKPTGNQEWYTTQSFLSTDGGFTFAYEGLRYQGVLDPENYRFSETNWQIITMDPNHRQIGWAMSTDGGNTFQSIGAFPNPEGADGYPWEIAAMQKPDAYRVYVGATGQDITSFYSDAAPWTTWTKDPGYRLQLDTTTGLESCGIGAPVVLKLGPVDFLMVYLTTIPGCTCGEDPTCP